MTHESFRPWAHGSPLPGWIIHFDSVTFGLIWGVISHVEEKWTEKASDDRRFSLFSFFCFVLVFVCQLRHSSEERVLQNENTFAMNENTGSCFLKCQLTFNLFNCSFISGSVIASQPGLVCLVALWLFKYSVQCSALTCPSPSPPKSKTINSVYLCTCMVLHEKAVLT